MGYCTDLKGSFTITPPLTPEQVGEMQRRINADDWPTPRPRYECAWNIATDGASLVPGGCDKPYDWREWVDYLIAFLAPIHRTLSGEIEWDGGENEDAGTMTIRDGRTWARGKPTLPWTSIGERDRREIAEGIRDTRAGEAAIRSALAMLGCLDTSDRVKLDE